MRLLLDENLPKRLKLDFPDHEVFTVQNREWNGVKNGELLKLLLDNSFDALLTFDKNLQHQQNFSKYTVGLAVSKFAAIAPAVMDCEATSTSIALLVGSAIA